MKTNRKFDIMRSKPWVHKRGDYPSRIVLIKRYNPDGTVKEYTTHLEVDQNGVQAFYSGHYHTTLINAKRDFAKRDA